jgi:hypothetical protein
MEPVKYEADTTQIPKGTAFTMIVPLNRDRSQSATFHIKEMSEDVFMAAQSLIDAKKDFEAVRLIIKALQTGGDPVDVLRDNFVGIRSASRLVAKFMEPVEGELKKS